MNNENNVVEPITPNEEPIQSTMPDSNILETEPATSTEPINQEIQIQSQLQNIPTVEQNKEQFINNVQSMNQEKKEEKKEGISFVFIAILFIVILVSIVFLFPILSKYV